MNAYETALGGLLHDIGKFMQRAHAPGTGLGGQSLGMREYVCPSYEGRHTHQHVLYTNEFMEKPWFLPVGLDRSAIANLASYHHRPDTKAHEMITLADRISSGMDREPDLDNEEDPRARFRRTRLVSVAAVVGNSALRPAQAPAFPLKTLSPNAAYPQRFLSEPDLTGEYRRLWDDFCAEWGTNRCPEPFGFVARAMSILERHTWCIPSATNALPDISLYDHMKTTAAIAVCLAADGADTRHPFLLAAGDLTGIQAYLYDIRPGSGSPARRLRARSFHVAAYAQSVCLGILHRLGLPPTQVILSAGGKFHLLLPNTPEVRGIMETAAADAETWLMTETAGDVALALAFIPCAQADLDDFSATLARLHHALRAERDRAGHRRLAGAGSWREEVFVLPPLEMRDGLCRACGRRGGTETTDMDGEVTQKCDACRDEEDTGRLLPKARYAAFYTDNSGNFPAPLGSYSIVAEDRRIHGRPALVVDMDGTPDGTARPEWPLNAQAWARHAPRHADGNLLTFEEIADTSTGRPALAFLKMDVDNLGWMFAHGLKREGRDRASISRVATLSRTLELFFRDHLQETLRDEFPEAYLVYSGGDDVLALGPWDKIMALAWRVREDFRGFTGNNPAWTLSAGVALAGHHTPVLTAAAEADRRLEASKDTPGSDTVPWPCEWTDPDAPPSKDRITAFGTSIPWDRYKDVLDQAKDLLSWIETDVVNSGKVRRLLHCAELHRMYQRTRDTDHLRYVPMLVYDLKRNWKESTPALQAAKEWAAALVTPESRDIAALRFICEYALYGARGRNREA